MTSAVATEQPSAEAPATEAPATEAAAPPAEATVPVEAPKEEASKEAPKEQNKVSAGVNHGNTAPVQSHSTVVGTPGDRYLFTESPVEYYYYHQPIV